MKNKSLIAILFAICLSANAFAADQVAKEEITPPSAEGPLTIDQIQPVNSLPMANMPPPAQPNPTQTTAPTATPPTTP